MSNKRKLSFAALLDRHAQVAVHVGLRPIPGQQIILSAPIEALPLVRLICKHAYMAGASLVTPLFSDGECTLARYRHATDASFDVASGWLSEGSALAFKEGAARMAISGDNPSLLSGQDPARVSRAAAAAGKASKPAMEYVTTSRVNWSICAYATKSWAKTAFPELSEKAAVAKLWRAIFAASRADAADPVAAWMEHNGVLKSRVNVLNERNFASLRFRGPGTDLLVGLADGHKWAGGSSTTPGGAQFNANVPTEERRRLGLVDQALVAAR
jgi:aminopeptidase